MTPARRPLLPAPALPPNRLLPSHAANSPTAAATPPAANPPAAPQPQAAQVSQAPANQAPAIEAPRPTGDVRIDTWTAVGMMVQDNRRLRILLADMRLESIARAGENMSARVRIPSALIGAARACEADLRQAFTRVLSAPVNLVIEPDMPVVEVVEQPATPRTPITEHPLIKAATQLLGARVITVQPRRPAT